MGKYLAACAALLLIAAAIFLPGQLAEWNDRALLDEPHITRQEKEREGFSERMQLSVAEKLLLLQSGQLSMVPLDDAFLTDAGTYVNVRYAINAGSVEYYQEDSVANSMGLGPDEAVSLFPGSPAYTAKELEEAADAAAQEWIGRLEQVQAELRILQTAGALPTLWSSSAVVEVGSRSQAVYVDLDSQLSFQTYSITLDCAPYTLSATVDAQSGKLLGFILRWNSGSQPAWGYRGAAYFGTAWRDYWGMDRVSANWFNAYNKSILEETEDSLLRNGDNNANSQIGFTYNDQTVNIPLINYATMYRGCAIGWNP